jgi:hypothetical protein
MKLNKQEHTICLRRTLISAASIKNAFDSGNTVFISIKMGVLDGLQLRLLYLLPHSSVTNTIDRRLRTHTTSVREYVYETSTTYKTKNLAVNE